MGLGLEQPPYPRWQGPVRRKRCASLHAPRELANLPGQQTPHFRANICRPATQLRAAFANRVQSQVRGSPGLSSAPAGLSFPGRRAAVGLRTSRERDPPNHPADSPAVGLGKKVADRCPHPLCWWGEPWFCPSGAMFGCMRVCSLDSPQKPPLRRRNKRPNL